MSPTRLRAAATLALLLATTAAGSSRPLAGLVAPSLALGERMAEVRRAQGYAIPYSPQGYLATNNCDDLGRWALLDFGHARTPAMPVADCAHPDHLAWRWRMGLIADAPWWIVNDYAGPGWAPATLIMLEAAYADADSAGGPAHAAAGAGVRRDRPVGRGIVE